MKPVFSNGNSFASSALTETHGCDPTEPALFRLLAGMPRR
jgi:hypothetical protein